ncbi:MAG: PIN domain-containing protein [Deltaproteobacteria bacterium]|nr:PIN domain-containing protein [Candidatus Tharpella aukensis]
MKIIVDTCVWSLALRRNTVKKNPFINELKNLIEEIRVQFIGPIRQELLSGIKSKKQFDTLKLHLEAFSDVELEAKDYELAAEYFNAARKKGIQGSNTDFLICAISSRRKMPILTTDKDFTNFQSVFPISLHLPRG